MYGLTHKRFMISWYKRCTDHIGNNELISGMLSVYYVINAGVFSLLFPSDALSCSLSAATLAAIISLFCLLNEDDDDLKIDAIQFHL